MAGAEDSWSHCIYSQEAESNGWAPVAHLSLSTHYLEPSQGVPPPQLTQGNPPPHTHTQSCPEVHLQGDPRSSQVDHEHYHSIESGSTCINYDWFCLVLLYPVNAEPEAAVYGSVTKDGLPEDTRQSECDTEVASHWEVLLVAMEKAPFRIWQGCVCVQLLVCRCWVLGFPTKVTDREWESKARVRGCWVQKPVPAAVTN